MSVSRYYFTVFADYFAFELLDEKVEPPANLWSEKTLSDRVAVAPGVIVVSTVRNMSVPVLIEVVDREEPDGISDMASWDHVAECSIDLPSGALVVFGTTGYLPEAPRIRMPPATYQARIYYGGLSTLTKDGLYGSDVYWIVLRPGPAIQPRVIKQWTETGSS